jgi:hypothetical protein
MDEEKAFLPHFIDEEIYIIDEVVSVETAPIQQESAVISNEQEIKEEPVKPIAEEPKQIYEAPKVEEVVRPTFELTFNGQNTKGVLLLVNNISAEERAFLEKVLGAVKLTMNDCALLSLSQNNSTEHQKLIENFKCKTIINLGGQPLPFLQGIKNYKINFLADKKVLITDDLTSIMADVAKKKLLWESLQLLFL